MPDNQMTDLAAAMTRPIPWHTIAEKVVDRAERKALAATPGQTSIVHWRLRHELIGGITELIIDLVERRVHAKS
jgi:hypothetical protein